VFNIAAHLLLRKRERSEKPAFVEDHGSLSYGALSEQVRRLAAGLLAAGVRREGRVLLLMHGCCQWQLAFLGASYAGIVPVAVNTLLTADDHACMLAHCRAQVVLVSDALRPALRQARAQAGPRARCTAMPTPTGRPDSMAHRCWD
jgi:benzoate-CoA ligase